MFGKSMEPFAISLNKSQILTMYIPVYKGVACSLSMAKTCLPVLRSLNFEIIGMTIVYFEKYFAIPAVLAPMPLVYKCVRDN